MDPAFLRRLPYKIEIGAPSIDLYKSIFMKECLSQRIELSDKMFRYIVDRITEEKRLELAAFQPRFILEQVVASCRFMEQPVGLEPRFLDYAIDNLRVKPSAPAMNHAEAAQLVNA
jgi:hypothetical protein